jgi:hypothetical protein
MMISDLMCNFGVHTRPRQSDSTTHLIYLQLTSLTQPREVGGHVVGQASSVPGLETWHLMEAEMKK